MGETIYYRSIKRMTIVTIWVNLAQFHGATNRWLTQIIGNGLFPVIFVSSFTNMILFLAPVGLLTLLPAWALRQQTQDQVVAGILSHSTVVQRNELLRLLDEFAVCFLTVLGSCKALVHEIQTKTIAQTIKGIPHIGDRCEEMDRRTVEVLCTGFI